MNRKSNNISVRKKVSVWNRPLKFNFKNLFKSLTKAAIEVSLGKFKWDSITKDIVDSVTTFEFKEDVNQLAYSLIQRALLKTLFDIAKENVHLLKPIDLKTQKEILAQLDLSIENEELEIDESFFTDPTDLTILNSIKTPFGQWIEGFGISKARANALMNRIKPYFLFNLDYEWCTNSNEYNAISRAIKSPFTELATQERNWLTYYSFLKKNIHEPILGIETFDITQVYVPLRAFFKEYKEIFEDKINFEIDGLQRKKEPDILNVVDLKEYLKNWLNIEDRKNSLKIITGGPGSGKSTFAKIFAEHIALQQIMRVMYIPLFKLNFWGDLYESVGHYAKNAHFFKKNPLDVSRNERILIIFDGADELPFQGKYSVENTTYFIREVKSLLNNLNEHSLKLKVIITGRSIVIQQSETELRKTGQVLNILPYYLTEHEQQKYNSPNGLIKEDQRNIWWKLYGHAIGKNYGRLPKDLKKVGKWLDDITSQPLLNYLVALSFERGKVKFDANTNVSVIYQDLLNAVHGRFYEKKADENGTLRLISEISRENFIRYLQEIAVSAWHNDGRTTSVKQIQDRCRTCGLPSLPDCFGEESKSGILRILTAFYFSKFAQTNKGDEIFEFTHKSFQEFLTSRRLIEEIKVLCSEINRRENNPYTGINEETALIRWVELCGPSKIDEDTAKFIVDQINLSSSKEVQEWVNVLCNLIRFIVKHDFPMEKLTSKYNFQEQKKISRNAEEALYFILQSSVSRSERIPLNDYEITEVISRYRMIGNSKFSLAPDIIEKLLIENMHRTKHIIDLKYLHVSTGTTIRPVAIMEIDIKGRPIKGTGTGNGPIDAVYNTIAKLTGTESELLKFSVGALGDKQQGGTVTILLREKDNLALGYGRDCDIIVAAAKAYISGINRLLEN